MRAAGPTAEQANVMVWDRARRGHYEVWFLMASALAEEASVWIRYTVEAPLDGEPPEARLWFAFCDARDPSRNVALNRGFPLSALATTRQPFEVMIGGGRITHGSATGAISGGGHKAAWDLVWTPPAASDPPMRYLPGFAYSTSITDTVAQDPAPSSPVRGEVEVDGRTVRFEGDPLVQEHLFGRKHAHAWGWGHCNSFAGDRAVVFEALAARVQRRGVVLPAATLAVLRIGDEEHRFTDLAFLPLGRAEMETGRFKVRATSRSARVVASFRCRPEDLVLAAYRDPDGAPRYCHNTGVADCTVELYRRTGLLSFSRTGSWEAHRSARLETAGPHPDPRVHLHHEPVAG